jgi:hypothetical protein
MKTRIYTPPGTSQQVRDGVSDLEIRFYIGPANTPRVEVRFQPNAAGFDAVVVDRPLSDFTALSGAEKTTLRNLLTQIRDQCFTLEGFA